MKSMGRKILGPAAAVLMAGPMAAHAVPVVFSLTSADNGGLSVTVTLDVVGGQALSGSGSITAASLDGGAAQGMTLVTAGYDGCNGDVASTFCFDFQPPPSNTGWVGDTVYNASSPYVSGYGLLFTVNDGNGSGFNLAWSGSAYLAWVAGVQDLGGGAGILNPDHTGSGGTYDAYQVSEFNSSVVPVPAAVWLFGSALGVLRVVRRQASFAGKS